MLVTGGTGTLGALVARHLVTAHGVRSCCWSAAAGAAADGVAELRAELTGAGRARSRSPAATSPTATRWPACSCGRRPTGR